MLGVGDFVLFFSIQGPEFCTEKLLPGCGDFDGKIVARGSAQRGDSNRSN